MKNFWFINIKLILNTLSVEEIFFLLKKSKRNIYLKKPIDLQVYITECRYLFELEYIEYNDIDWSCQPTPFISYLLKIKKNKTHKHSWGLKRIEIDWKKTLSKHNPT